jgi:hypothetical protein
VAAAQLFYRLGPTAAAAEVLPLLLMMLAQQLQLVMLRLWLPQQLLVTMPQQLLPSLPRCHLWLKGLLRCVLLWRPHCVWLQQQRSAMQVLSPLRWSAAVCTTCFLPVTERAATVSGPRSCCIWAFGVQKHWRMSSGGCTV